MSLRMVLLAVSAMAVGYLLLTAPELIGFTLMLFGAVALWRSSRRWGVRR